MITGASFNFGAWEGPSNPEPSSNMPQGYLSMTISKVKEQFGERLQLDEQLCSNGKTIVLAGTLDGAPVVLKSLVTDNDFYSASFRHEMHIYEVFAQHKPPFGIPEIRFVSEEPPVVLLERIDGRLLSEDRFPGEEELSPEGMERIFDLLGQVRKYDAGVTDERSSVLKRYQERWTKYIQHGIYTEEDQGILRLLDETSNWKPEFNHGDPVPRNIILAKGEPLLIDWEFGGSYVPFYDVAVLWAVACRQPELQRALERRFDDSPREDRVCFAANALNVASRELRIHMDLPDGHEIKADRLKLLIPLMERSRAIIQSLQD